MPPRYAYWTILVDDQPTAFRAGAQEDLMPTFKRLQARHASAKMMWFQNGKLWDSRLDAQEAMRARGEMGRRGDQRQVGFRDRERKPFRNRNEGGKRSAWSPRGEPSTPAKVRDSENKLDWKPKGEFVPASKRADRPGRSELKPKPSFDRDRKPGWKPKTSRPRENPKLDWKPRGEAAGPSTRDELPRRKPAARSGSGRDKTWRPGGEHKDPRQKYKDAKKAKWTRFKQTIRKRWEGKPGKKGGK